jgi:hypothetical protein
VAESDLVVWIGPELTPGSTARWTAGPEGAASLALLAAEGTMRRAYGEAKPDANGHDEEHATRTNMATKMRTGMTTDEDGHEEATPRKSMMATTTDPGPTRMPGLTPATRRSGLD